MEENKVALHHDLLCGGEYILTRKGLDVLRKELDRARLVCVLSVYDTLFDEGDEGVAIEAVFDQIKQEWSATPLIASEVISLAEEGLIEKWTHKVVLW